MRRLKALALTLFACGGAVEPVATRYDVTERGVINTPVDETPFDTPSRDWVEVRAPWQSTFVRVGSAPNLSRYVFGRADRQFSQEPALIDVDIDGLDWKSGDSLQLVSPNVGLSIHGLEAHLPSVGKKSVKGQFDWAATDSPLIDSARGDTTHVMQMSSRRTTAGTFYYVVTRTGATAFTTREHASSPLKVSLTEIAPDRTLDFQWRGSAYGELAKDVGGDPQLRGAVAQLSIRTLPTEVANHNTFFRQSYNYLPSVVDFGPVRAREDLRQTLSYGNPFSRGAVPWSEVATMSYAVPVVVPEAGTLFAQLLQSVPVDDLARHPFAPVISPVRNVRIDHRPLLATMDGVGREPTLTWDVPALGTASNYLVLVQAIVPDAVEGRKILATGTFVTDTPSLKVPAFAMADASAYVFTITAIASPGSDLGKTPHVGARTFASADYISAVVRP